MRNLSVLLPLALVMLLSSCTGNEEAGKGTAGNHDTMITVMKDGDALSLSVSSETFIVHDILSIDTLMRKYKGKPLEKEMRSSVDVTGDSIPEEVIARTFNDNGSFKVMHIIRSGEKVIFRDSLMIDDSWGAMALNDTSVYHQLFPYSGFYAGLSYLPMIEDNTDTENFIHDPVALALHKARLEKKGLKEPELTNEINRFTNYLATFKGKLVYGLEMMDGGLYIWYEPENDFVLLYAP